MKRFLGAVVAVALAFGLGGKVRADDKDAQATLDKAIKALGGEEKLAKTKAFSWKSKGRISFGGNDNEFTSRATYQGLDHYRGEFEGDFNGNQVKGVTVLNGDKGWRKFGDMAMEMDDDAIANEKRSIYLQVVPVTVLPLKGKGFKVESSKEEMVDGKPAVALKVTGPDGKPFTIYFDKDSGLPVKQVATVAGFGGDEYTQESTFGSYKDLDGIKVATKVQNKRDGEKFLDLEHTEFKVEDRIDPKTFSEPD